ncbi:MAG: hypothetical protein M3155_09710, partial [Actinomycetota bacterium]|nr:hypothetical protein [Actinomycetota bacterium]
MGRIPTRALALACALGAGLVAPGVLWAADQVPDGSGQATTAATVATTPSTDAPPPPATTTTAAT